MICLDGGHVAVDQGLQVWIESQTVDVVLGDFSATQPLVVESGEVDEHNRLRPTAGLRYKGIGWVDAPFNPKLIAIRFAHTALMEVPRRNIRSAMADHRDIFGWKKRGHEIDPLLVRE